MAKHKVIGSKKFDDTDGVWRTIKGRHIFIRNGQSLQDAMKDSGKFDKKEMSYEEETDKEKRLRNVYNMDRVLRAMNNEEALDDGWLMNGVADEDSDEGFENFKEYSLKYGSKNDWYYADDEDYGRLVKMYKNRINEYAKDGVLTRDWFRERSEGHNWKASAGLDNENLEFLKKDFPEYEIRDNVFYPTKSKDLGVKKNETIPDSFRDSMLTSRNSKEVIEDLERRKETLAVHKGRYTPEEYKKQEDGLNAGIEYAKNRIEHAKNYSWLSYEDKEWLNKYGHEARLGKKLENFKSSGNEEIDRRRLNDISSNYFYNDVGIYNENIDSVATKWAYDKAQKYQAERNNQNNYLNKKLDNDYISYIASTTNSINDRYGYGFNEMLNTADSEGLKVKRLSIGPNGANNAKIEFENGGKVNMYDLSGGKAIITDVDTEDFNKIEKALNSYRVQSKNDISYDFNNGGWINNNEDVRINKDGIDNSKYDKKYGLPNVAERLEKENSKGYALEERQRQVKATEELYKEDLKKKEDRPVAKKLAEQQGKSTRKDVKNKIQQHILEYYGEDYTGEDIPASEAFVRQMDAMGNSNKWSAGQEIAKGGSYLIYNDDMRAFLDDLKINPKGKKFSDDKVFDTYTSLIGRESKNLYEAIQKEKLMNESQLIKAYINRGYSKATATKMAKQAIKYRSKK